MEAITTSAVLSMVEKPRHEIDKFLMDGNQTRQDSMAVNGLERVWVYLRVLFTIVTIALQCYRSVPKAWIAVQGIKFFMRQSFGSHKTRRYIKLDGKYHFGMYVPAFPSKRYDDYIRTELSRFLYHTKPVNRLQAIQLAITNKCPMQCEHCLEWNNLNRVETFTTDELKKIIDVIQQEGCTQIYFTGGEPLVRMKKLEELIRHASAHSDCWVLTSGHHFTPENALRLKKAGARGVSVSLDHFEERAHNRFRGSDHAYEEALQAVENANRVKLVTAFSICLTRTFITEGNLIRYAELAKDCGVSFVQVLEPRAVGHYEGKAVSLSKEQLSLLDAFFLKINYDPQYRNYPVFIYQGYQQRKVGCLSGGKLSLYIDAAGFIDACPYCHTHSFDVHDILSGKLTMDQIQMTGCPMELGRQTSQVSSGRQGHNAIKYV